MMIQEGFLATTIGVSFLAAAVVAGQVDPVNGKDHGSQPPLTGGEQANHALRNGTWSEPQ